ncbi:MAG: hypothetical protein ACLQQB_11635 [Solirubrobacteraceae bacterium]|jgi:hypothetical protein
MLDAAITTLRLRHAVPILLATTGVISVYLVSVANGTTWKAVWIGVASTMFASGLVDASVQIEAVRRERAVLRIAGERVARINQNVLLLISSAFDLQVDVSEMHATLAALTDHKIDLSAIAPRVFPEQTKLQGVMVHLAEIDQSLEFAVTLGSLTHAAARLERLDDSIRSSVFLIALRHASINPRMSGPVLVDSARELFETMREQHRWFGRRGGSTWRAGRY